MKTVCVFLVLVISGALAMQIRPKRQSSQPDDTNDLEDRYGPNRFPGQGQFNGFLGQNQFQGQNPFLGQNPFQGQNSFQGQNPFLGQNQFQGQNPFLGQNQFLGQNPFLGQNQFGQNNGRFPPLNTGVNNQQQQQQQPSTANPNDNTVRDCIRNCPVTSEYNPVCGTDGTTYTNPGRLGCAQTCGVNVSLLRSAPCPPPSTTAAPSQV